MPTFNREKTLKAVVEIVKLAEEVEDGRLVPGQGLAFSEPGVPRCIIGHMYKRLGSTHPYGSYFERLAVGALGVQPGMVVVGCSDIFEHAMETIWKDNDHTAQDLLSDELRGAIIGGDLRAFANLLLNEVL